MEHKSLFARGQNIQTGTDESEYDFIKVLKEDTLEYQLFNKTSILKRSTSAPDLNSTMGIGKETKNVFAITTELLITKRDLMQKIKECDYLIKENCQLKGLLDSECAQNKKSLLERVFVVTKKKRDSQSINSQHQIETLRHMLFKANIKLEEQIDQMGRDRQELKVLKKKNEIKEMELLWERDRRKDADMEISNIRNHFYKRENGYKMHIDALKEAEIKEMQSMHMQKINALHMIIQQQKEELLQNNFNFKQSIEAETESLLKLLQLKNNELSESNYNLRNVQNQLNDLKSGGFKLENYETRNESMKKLENAKQYIMEVLNELKLEKECAFSGTESINTERSKNCKPITDKEEVVNLDVKNLDTNKLKQWKQTGNKEEVK